MKHHKIIPPKKSLGQNLLIDKEYLNKIALEVEPDYLILEIGAGTGNLTQALLDRGVSVTAIEIDQRLIPELNKRFQGKNLKIIHNDFLLFSEHDVLNIVQDKAFIIFGNLPYLAATKMIQMICEWKNKPKKCIFLLQKEVAERLAAKPDTKSYGSLSIFVQFFSKPKILFQIPPEAFYPIPKVISSVICLEFYKESPYVVDNRDEFFQFVRKGFSQRRKMLKNALTIGSQIHYTEQILLEIMARLGIAPNVRAEDLSLNQFVDLYNLLHS